MKFIRVLLACSISAFCFAQPASYEAYMATLSKVTTLIQNISQKITQEMMSQPISRSEQSFSTSDYTKKMIEEIEKEIEKITEPKKTDQLSQEEKDLIEMLEMYKKQIEMCASMQI